MSIRSVPALTSPPALLPARAALASLLDGIDEPLLLFDALGRASFCNRAAMRLLGAEPGQPAHQLGAVLGEPGAAWLLAQLNDAGAGPRQQQITLPDQRGARLECWNIGRDLALRLRVEAPAPPLPAALPPVEPGPTLEMLRMLWASPFPATLQDAQFRLVAVNDAYLEFTGRTREALVGTDPVLLQPLEDQAPQIEARRELPALLAAQAVPRLNEQRLIDASGRERWSRASAYPVLAMDGLPLLLCVLQDSTAEHVARAQADRSLDELAQWFDLSPTGMLVFDEAGLIVRSNPAFEALVGQVPVLLADASAELQALLAWQDGAPRPALRPGAAPLETHVSLPLPDGRRQRLSARVRGFATGQGLHRFMAVVEDRSAEEERDLAQLEIGALMDTAGVGVATFDSARGWLRPRAERRRSPARAVGLQAGLQSIARDIVEPESLPEYERLQQALRLGQRTEVRYAVQHAELGRRWLLTRVEPGDAESGRRTVVTVDVTEQESAQRQSQQLLRELTTILDGTTAGIAYLRGAMLVRCNRRFEAMLGLEAGAAAGATINELFGRFPQALAALQAGSSFETELPLAPGWYSLSVRRAEPATSDNEVVAVLTDISRLKSQQAELEALLRERDRAREELLRQAERTRAILDSVLVGIVTVGDGGIEWMNRSARRMFAGDLADFVGEPIATVATPEPGHPLRRTDYHLTLAEGRAQNFECRLKARDGREFWVVGNAVLSGGEASGRQITFALLDIERRRQAEVSIAQAQASLQRIIETAPLAIALFDAQSMRMLQVNQMASAFFGRPVHQLMGATARLADDAEATQALVEALVAAGASNEVRKRELRLRAPAGERLWDTRFVSLPASAGARAQVLLVASDVTEQRAEAQARFDAALAQREMLVKEVHHRIKNNLQGVAGLLQQNAARHPELAAVLGESVGQVQAIAQVYGLQVGAGGPLRVASVVEAIALSVQRTFGRTVRVAVHGDEPVRLLLPEAEAIPIALTINELLTNAVKHSSAAEVLCELDTQGEALRVRVRNAGRLREGFDLAQYPGGVSGLGLVRALLPRRSATFSLGQQGDEVLAEVLLRPPSVQRDGA